MDDLISRNAAINTDGLDEEIRCEMCRNQMKTGRGCDGNCKYDEKLYEKIMQILNKRITPQTPDAADQTAKADAGKPQLTLVPRKIIFDIARIREYGNKKYGDPDNWKTVEPQRYRDAAYRHLLAYLDNPSGVDEESGLEHLWHLACNIAFLCEMEDS